MKTTRYEPAGFLNIDLEIKSRRSLEPLVEAWPGVYEPGKIEGRKPRWLLLNVSDSRAHDAEGTAKALLRRVERLRGEALRSWKGAHDRVFDIGIQAPGPDPRRAFEEVQLTPETLKRLAAAGARVKVTVYPAEPERPDDMPPKTPKPPNRKPFKRLPLGFSASLFWHKSGEAAACYAPEPAQMASAYRHEGSRPDSHKDIHRAES